MDTDTGVETKALLAAGLTVLLWASAFVVIRDAAPHFTAGALALGRLLAGSLALCAILVIRREGLPPRAAWPGIVCAGLLWFGLYMVALNWGEQHVDAGTAALLINIGPILIGLLGGWLLGEGFPPRLIIGMVVAFGGAALVGFATSSDGPSAGAGSITGIIACVLAAIGYAAGVVGQKPALRHASALQVTTFSCVIGTVACLPFTPQLIDGLATAPAGATVGMVYLGLFPTALAFLAWAYALSRTTAGKLGATTYAVPLLVVLISWIALSETPAPLALAGGALCLVGVALSRGKGRSRRAPREHAAESLARTPDKAVEADRV